MNMENLFKYVKVVMTTSMATVKDAKKYIIMTISSVLKMVITIANLVLMLILSLVLTAVKHSVIILKAIVETMGHTVVLNA
jgi:phage-related protein